MRWTAALAPARPRSFATSACARAVAAGRTASPDAASLGTLSWTVTTCCPDRTCSSPTRADLERLLSETRAPAFPHWPDACRRPDRQAGRSSSLPPSTAAHTCLLSPPLRWPGRRTRSSSAASLMHPEAPPLPTVRQTSHSCASAYAPPDRRFSPQYAQFEACISSAFAFTFASPGARCHLP